MLQAGALDRRKPETNRCWSTCRPRSGVTRRVAFDADLRLTAYRVESVANQGAYNSEFQPAHTRPNSFSKVNRPASTAPDPHGSM